MGKVLESITPQLTAWIGEQKLFFVATAPLAADGLVNCSPKGLDSFRVLDEHTVAYQDLTGSGAETIAHLKENKRIVVMFCAFNGPPKIVRLQGQGQLVLPTHPDFDKLESMFQPHAGTRAFIRIHVTRIADSCGYAVPQYEFKQDRDVLNKWTASKTPEELQTYRNQKNQFSLDNLPALTNE